ncbi:MAG: hypothetical protein HYS09_03220 [Chloroflexi bacterium]|nr:hypothetical protein [Chloroflexota bacterium]
MRSLFAFMFAGTMLVALGAIAAACGGGNELEESLQSLTNGLLAVMVLPKEELGPDAADLPLDNSPSESGFQDNKAAAQDTADPNDTAADVAEAGRINGYELSYSDFSRLGEAEGAVEADTAVELYRDADAASAWLARLVNDIQGLEGQEAQEGFSVKNVETFTIDGLGDEATGLRYRFSVGDATGHTTLVIFRLDRLLAGTVQVRNDDKDVDSQVEQTARSLEERIKGVALGDITATPVPLR